MKDSRSIVQHLVLSLVMTFLVYPFSLVQAERGSTPEQSQEMKQMMDMLEKSGMDPQQMGQMEDMLGGMAKQGARIQAAKIKKAQQKFQAETEGHGMAQVEVAGKQYELTMTECKITDRGAGNFSLQARQAPGNEDARLFVNGGSSPSGSTMQFTGKKIWYEASNNPTFHLNDKTVEWEGTVQGEKGNIPLKFWLTCGAEMVDYAQPSQPKPASSVNVLTLHMGEEAHTFQSGHCSTEGYRTGNLMVQFGVTATGTFRGRSAIVLLSKSHPVGSKQTFQDMDLLLGELTPEQRLLSPLKVAEELRDNVNAYTNKEMITVQKNNKEKMAAFQKKYGKEAPKDTSKMGEWMNAFNRVLDAQSKAMNEVQEQAKAMRYPKGQSFGTITVKGQEVHFGGSKLSTQDLQRAPEFQNLPEKTELWVTCGK